jgi:hypothetical protein
VSFSRTATERERDSQNQARRTVTGGYLFSQIIDKSEKQAYNRSINKKRSDGEAIVAKAGKKRAAATG